MARGRKADPIEVKNLRGTLRGDRLPGDPVFATTDQPEWSWLDDPQVEAWCNHILQYLRAENRVSKSDELMVMLAARKMKEIKALDLLIQKNGGPMYWKDSKDGGSWKALPAVGQLHDAERQLQSALSELGLGPAARNKVAAVLRPAEANEWADAGFSGDQQQVVN